MALNVKYLLLERILWQDSYSQSHARSKKYRIRFVWLVCAAFFSELLVHLDSGGIIVGSINRTTINRHNFAARVNFKPSAIAPRVIIYVHESASVGYKNPGSRSCCVACGALQSLWGPTIIEGKAIDLIRAVSLNAEKGVFAIVKQSVNFLNNNCKLTYWIIRGTSMLIPFGVFVTLPAQVGSSAPR